MPNRIIRDGLVDSEAVDALSDWAYRCYTKLLLKCDDAGRFSGRAEMLRSLLFPLGTSRRADDFAKAVSDMKRVNLVIPYKFDGKPLLQVTKWQRCGNAVRSKFPWTDGTYDIEYIFCETRDGKKEFVASSISATPYPPHADGGTTDSDTETDYGDGLRITKTKDMSADADFPPGLIRVWKAAPSNARERSGRPECLIVWKKEKLEPLTDVILAALECWKNSAAWKKQGGEFIPGLHRWLKRRQWEDQAVATSANSHPKSKLDEKIDRVLSEIPDDQQ